MKIASFDVGIRNMAYCIFSINDENNTETNVVKTEFVVDWNVINLLEMTAPVSGEKCNCKLALKKKGATQALCGRVAKFSKDQQYYCDKHAKKQTEYIIRPREHSTNKIKLMKIDALNEIVEKYNIGICGANEYERSKGLYLRNDSVVNITQDIQVKKTKINILKNIEDFFNKRELDVITKIKGKNTKEIDLIEIGRNMKTKLDEILEFNGITHVIIENQFSTVASRMKCIQGMLAQYFIMKEQENRIQIEFISSANKLKLWKNDKPKKQKENLNENEFENIVKDDITQDITDQPRVNADYKEHKNDAVFYCREILTKNPELFTKWRDVLNTKKKDDLADCFLMGVWYIYGKPLVSCKNIIIL